MSEQPKPREFVAGADFLQFSIIDKDGKQSPLRDVRNAFDGVSIGGLNESEFQFAEPEPFEITVRELSSSQYTSLMQMFFIRTPQHPKRKVMWRMARRLQRQRDRFERRLAQGWYGE